MNQDLEEKSSQYSPPPSYSSPPPAQYPGPPPAQPPPGLTCQWSSPSVTIQGHESSALGFTPGQYTCPSCREVIVTRVEKKVTTTTHSYAILLFIFMLWPFMWLPYFLDSCRNIDHYCPSCDAYIGTYGTHPAFNL